MNKNIDINFEIIKSVIDVEGEDGLKKMCKINKEFLKLCKDNRKGLLLYLLGNKSTFGSIDFEKKYIDRLKNASYEDLRIIYENIKEMDGNLKYRYDRQMGIFKMSYEKLMLSELELENKMIMTDYYIEYIGNDIVFVFINIYLENINDEDSKKIYKIWEYVTKEVELSENAREKFLKEIYEDMLNKEDMIEYYISRYDDDKRADKIVKDEEKKIIILNMLASDIIKKYNAESLWNKIKEGDDDFETESENESETDESNSDAESNSDDEREYQERMIEEIDRQRYISRD